MQKNSAFLFARITPTNEETVLEELQQLDCVEYAVLLLGKYDLVTKISAKNVESLNRAVLEEVRKIPGLELTKTFVCDLGSSK